MRELREQMEKFGGKSEWSTNHKSMEEVCYKENLELGDQSKDSGQVSSLETVRDSEGEVGQEVVGISLGGGSGMALSLWIDLQTWNHW